MTIWYTGTGDKGKTKIPSAGEVWKDEDIVNALGDIDELNSALGVVSSLYPELGEIIKKVQSDLFSIASEIAGFDLNFNENEILWLENKINEFSSVIPPLKNFVLPGGHLASSFLQLSRAICRRSERSVVKIMKSGKAKEVHVRYLNRLSSLLFVIALWVNQKTNNPNTIWKP
ncbi:ATP:cob(I)alamin adenosyltransferase [Sulfolobus sp. A20]|uniref:cob(I)yrinic acid a,c-diamide adenosyltransferase n=1 Tax=Sulfolobaceae TaxID=118883 RepID=UPI000845CC17|nr:MULTISPECIES: cob(I)yrinic acid a,c-diamide adenosyltransferase [unclassified Sulfolobus]TRM73675.1 cob(I)yrinic acid a,c-diamide adenosyltransferase [Sulfolobus sp. B5]TRM75423.1 cob(I)yrinic acid a,c-diamide adenosyltransferase [Sulfolobus sp. E5]TRM76031.1 cob(I)yrinic acid a,c-diamide adenosyltransferase [Sulfolobus sp. A20-N-F8]TRM81770.1 cob(I)yrinic acid a,c-diamide adenosyltransferase [Sulfolobus sp. A20-N-F6]TRM84644.1 cob(I)yrinic acid a,c-diamide adenosyltransferase [Sulfolobus s